VALAGWLGWRLVAGVWAVGLLPAWAQTDTPATPGLVLQASPLLMPTLPAEVQPQLPVFVQGSRITGQPDGRVQIEGPQAELRRHGTLIRADQLSFEPSSNQAQAEGQVLIQRNGNRFEGGELHLNLDTAEGRFAKPTFALSSNGGLGDASRVDFLGQDRLSVHNARYSTCPRPPGQTWMPAWLMRATRIDLDQADDTGVAVGGVLEFQGVPLLAAPYLSFPLSDRRKSGLLPPTVNIDNISGLELTLPYYFNIAPELDATVYPTYMSKRGVDLGGELRYLQDDYQGQLRAAWMPSDLLRSRQRWGYAWQHQHAGLGLPGLGLSFNINRVSDDDYWRDFPRSSTSLTSRLLNNQVVLHWAQGPWALEAGVHRWQTLQDLSAPITPPYDRLPSIALRYGREQDSWGGTRGWDWSLRTEATRFQADAVAAAPDRYNGTRVLAVADISRRWQTPGSYLKPRLQLHATQYQLDGPLSNGQQTLNRAVPTFSIDGGLFYERDASFQEHAYIQTLEPRAFFTWTPYRDQSLIPNYDAAANDFNFSSLFTENAFGGQDRIADTRGLTLGARSRLIDAQTGAEVVRLGVAQRYLLRDQSVVLPNAAGLPGGSPLQERFSDILFSADLQWNTRWALGSNVQFNPSERQSVRTTFNARYTPSNYRVLSTAYRLQRGISEQVEVGWQWPLNDLWSPPAQEDPRGLALGPGQWFGVGRVNYSVPDRKVVDLVAGFEYDAGCWLGRVVVERLQRSSASANQRILLQLEFSGFTRIGSNPLKTLRDNVPRYQYLREEIKPSSPFEYYD